MTDRITICEARLDKHDTDIENVGGGGKGDVTKEELATLKREMTVKAQELQDMLKQILAEQQASEKDGGSGVGTGYVIKYPDGRTKTLDKMLPPQWNRMMDLATTRDNIFLAGPTQCGKTTTAEMIAEALDLRFSALSCSEGLDESLFAGSLLPVGEDGAFEYVPSTFVDFYENGGVFLLDEFCASDSNLGVFMNNASGNDHFYLPRRFKNPLVKKHKDFVLIAADNTLGNGGDDVYVGRNQMDGSTMERFRTGFIVMDYSKKVEQSIADEDIYDWAIMIRKAITSLQMNRHMTTRTMKRFTIMKNERNWKIKDMEAVYFADWPKDDVKRVMEWIKQDLQKALQKG